MGDNIVFENHIMRYITNSEDDSAFIRTLFKDEKVRKYFVLSDVHSQNIDLFIAELAKRNNNHQGANLIIETNEYTPVGIITTHIDRTYFGEYILRASCAILSDYRGHGYAKMALKGLIFLLQPSNFKRLFLLISEDNIPSQMVAQSCGFERDRFLSTVDPNHPEVGCLFNWVRNIHFETTRDIIGHKGFLAQRAKNYQDAISFFEQALNEEYNKACVYSDAMIYSNMGMIFSSLKQYNMASECLGKAWSLGCQNPTIKKELEWLKDKTIDKEKMHNPSFLNYLLTGDNNPPEGSVEFVSTDHIRFQNGEDVSGHNFGCNRKIIIEKNIEGKEGYTVTIYNLDGVHPLWQNNIQMAPKRMRITSVNDNIVELRGYGYDEHALLLGASMDAASFENYGLCVLIDERGIIRAQLNMYERNISIVYLK